MRVDPTAHPCYDNILAVSAAVLTAERDVDGSILALSNLMATTIEQYADAKLPAHAAQPALAKLVEALTANVEGRRLLGEAHLEYGRTAKMMGATADDWGPSWPCPPGITSEQRQPRRSLKIAAERCIDGERLSWSASTGMMAALFLSLWLGVCGFALWRGGQPERLVALLFLAAFVLSVMADRRGYLWHGLQLGAFVIDLLLFVALTAIALRANRYWPIGMAGMQLLQVGGHLLKLADPRMLPLAYWLSAAFWAYPMLILLALGTVRHRNRVRNLGPEPSWSNFSHPPASATAGIPPGR